MLPRPHGHGASRVVIVGESVSRRAWDDCLRSRDPIRRAAHIALTGACGKKLATLAGISPLQFYRRTERYNVARQWRKRWDRDLARHEANRLLPYLHGKKAIILGVRASQAFGLSTYPPLEFRGVLVVTGAGTFTFEAALFPHPSALNRYWHDPDETARAARFLQVCLGGA